jgi:hypothetical protein
MVRAAHCENPHGAAERDGVLDGAEGSPYPDNAVAASCDNPASTGDDPNPQGEDF